MRALLPNSAWSAVEAHARQGYPHEICGVLLGRAGDPLRIQEAHPCANRNTERAQDRYLIDPLQQMRFERDGRRRGLDVVGYFHSHPDHPAVPSVTDLELSWENLLYLIVSLRDGKVVEAKAWVRPSGQKNFEEVALEALAEGQKV